MPPDATLDGAFTQYRPPAPSAARPRVRGFDELRGIAVVAVVLFHARILPAGWVGVDLFFGLSGFLITTILCDARASGASLGACLRPFYARRALRILPLAWTVCLLTAVLTGQWTGALWYGGFAVNWLPHPPAPRELAHFWTLAVEEQFYLLWPVVILCASRRAAVAACVAIPLMDTVARAVLYGSGWSYATEHVLGNATVARADPLAVGALLALLFVAGRSIPAWRLWLTAAAAGALLGGLLAAVTFAHRLEGTRYVLQPLLLAVLVGCVLQGVVRKPPRWLAAPALAWLGTLSYGIYVVHGALTPWFVAHVPSTPLRTAGLLTTSIALAWVSWHILEAPILAQKRRWPMPQRSGSREHAWDGVRALEAARP